MGKIEIAPLTKELLVEAEFHADRIKNELEELRSDSGDELWAYMVGKKLVDNMIVATSHGANRFGYQATILILKPMLDEINDDLSLAQLFTQGVRSQMEERGFFKELKVTE